MPKYTRKQIKERGFKRERIWPIYRSHARSSPLSSAASSSFASTRLPLPQPPPQRPPKTNKKKNPNWQALRRNKKKENEYNFLILLSFSLYEQNERKKILHKYLMDFFYLSSDHSILDEAEKIKFEFETMDDLESVKTGEKYCDKNID